MKVFGRISASASLLLAGLSLTATTARAQWDPEGGDTGATGGWTQPTPPPQQTQQMQPPPQQQWQPQPPPQQPPPQQPAWQQPAPAETPPPVNADEGDDDSDSDSDENDHAAMAKRLGFGWNGFTSVPIPLGGTLPVDGTLPAGVTAPTVGMRYWLSPSLGVEFGLGVGFRSLSSDIPNNTADPFGSAYAIALHTGLPIALFHKRHYAFLLIPELGFGYAGGSSMSMVDPDEADLFTGLAFRVGARIGAEIHFGFIDVPELSVEGSVGLNLNVNSLSADICTSDGCRESALTTASVVTIGTTVDGEPWDIFTGTIRARYYL